jgi:hypothetical protein
MVHLIVLDASVITTLVAGCQWASKLGAFGARSAVWATENWRARAGTTPISPPGGSANERLICNL